MELQHLVSTLNNPVKEVSKSMAAVINLRKFIHPGGRMNYVVIGDGSRCLPGAFLAFFTKGNVWSIDPAIKQPLIQDWMATHNVSRFKPVPKRIQDVQITGLDNNPVTLVLIHTHVSIHQTVDKFPNWRFIYVNPCRRLETRSVHTIYQDIPGIQCVFARMDKNIASDENSVFIYHNNAKFPNDRLQV
jgi:hypothetical protein